MLILWPQYVSRKGRSPALCIAFLGGFKGLLWFADVTLHSIWKESFPGAVRQGPSFALIFSPGCDVREESAQENSTGWTWTWSWRGGRRTQKHTVCAYTYLAYLNAKTRRHLFFWLHSLHVFICDSEKKKSSNDYTNASASSLLFWLFSLLFPVISPANICKEIRVR